MSRTTTICVRQIQDVGYGVTFGANGAEQVLTLDDLRELQSQISLTRARSAWDSILNRPKDQPVTDEVQK